METTHPGPKQVACIFHEFCLTLGNPIMNPVNKELLVSLVAFRSLFDSLTGITSKYYFLRSKLNIPMMVLGGFWWF